MGSSGTSSSNQTQTQTQSATPYGPASGVLQGILGNLQNINPNLTGAESGALDWLSQNGGNQFSGSISDVARTLLGGGVDRTGMATDAYADYQRRLSPIADGSLDPNSNPALRGYLDVARSDASNNVNSLFAGAGRDLSGAHIQALGRGIGQAEAPILYDAYNQAADRQRSAADALYGAGNTSTGLLSGLDQTRLGNQVTGIDAAGAATDASNSGAMATLAAEAQRRGIPLQVLAQQMGIAGPIAEAFGTRSSSGTTQGTQTKSLADTFATWTQGLSNLFPKYSYPTGK